MTDVTSWLDDELQFEREVQRTLAVVNTMPEVPGYRDLRELGRGGQGVVYAAVQLSTRRTVAVKILREAPLDGIERRRFEREVELAALLQHPNVVALHDSGLTADGRPFLAMELIDGPTIEFSAPVLDAHDHGLRRPWRDELLRMFAAVCDGVGYAHRHGIVHRDLKPGNIRIDAEGVPKVLDFGLARNLTADDESPRLTIGGTGVMFMGSLPWASPEQALGRTDEIDTRSDVYALGVVLYQLLTGSFPYDVDSDLRSALDAIASTPPTRPGKVARGIDADLETIVLHCLQKDPARRYQSATGLARDLHRYLDGAPIDARRDSTWYLLRTTARRHRGAVISAALVMASLVAGLVATLVLWQQAETDRAHAIDHARRAESAMQFVSETLVAVDPDRAGPDARVIDMVERAATDLPNRFGDDPDTRGFFYVKLIELFRNLGATQRALELADQSIEHSVAAFGKSDPRSVFARANRALLVHQLGRSSEVVAELEELAELVRAEPEIHRSGGHHVLSNLGTVLLALNRIDDAERAFTDCNQFSAETGLAPHAVAYAYETRATIASYRGNHAEAIRLLQLAVPIREAAYGSEHSSTLHARGDLAYYLAQNGDVEQAEAITAFDLEIHRRKFGPTDTGTLTTLNNHANYLERLGRLEEAQHETEECLRGRIEVLGETHPHTMITIGNLASIAAARGDYATAEQQYLHIIEVSSKVRGAGHTDTLILRNNRARALQASGRIDEAIEVFTSLVTDAETALGADSFHVALFRGNLGGELLRAKRYAEAEVELRESVRVLEAQAGVDAPGTRTMRGRLIELLRATDRDEEADALAPK